MSERRQQLADVVGLIAIVAVLLSSLHPALLFTKTIPAGGDLPSHYPTALWLRDHLLPDGRIHGWYPGAYLGHPLLLYYFPLPFLAIVALGLALPMTVAFKLVVAMGPLLLPFAAFLTFRMLRVTFPGPLLAASAAAVFLFVEENPIWGGTLASVFTGEFAYAYGLALALVYLGALWWARASGRSPWVPAALLALTALCHGYAVLWVGCASVALLALFARPLRTIVWLAGVGLLALALAGFWLVPLLADWAWTTPYALHHIPVRLTSLAPPLLWPFFGLAVLGLADLLRRVARGEAPDLVLVLLLYAALSGLALGLAGRTLGIIDVRFAPMAQLALALAGALYLARLLAGRRLAPGVALGLLAASLVVAQVQSRVVRPWAEWVFSGMEVKEGWPAVRNVAEVLRGSLADPRVKVENAQLHEKAGSTRAFELLPLLAGRATLEGVYNQASLSTHAIYYVAAELDASPPNPFPDVEYPERDVDAALAHLELFNVREIVAASRDLTQELSARPRLHEVAQVPPYAIFRLEGTRTGYVEPLAFAPVRSSPRGWRQKGLRWLSRRPVPRALVVFTDDVDVGVPEQDEWLPPQEVPLPEGVRVTSRLTPREISIHTSQIGHPLLVKVSFHPRWKAEGADGPYPISPALMLVVPRAHDVILRYSLGWADWGGAVATLGALVGALAWALLLRRRAREAGPGATGGGVGWAVALPMLLLVTLGALRMARAGPVLDAELADDLYARATRAQAEGRFGDAAEYARHAAANTRDRGLWVELTMLRGESLRALGRWSEALPALEAVLQRDPGGPYEAQALYGLCQVYGAVGRAGEAERSRERLRSQFGETPWAALLAEERPAADPSGP